MTISHETHRKKLLTDCFLHNKSSFLTLLLSFEKRSHIFDGLHHASYSDFLLFCDLCHIQNTY